MLFLGGLALMAVGASMVYRRVPPYTNYLGQNIFPASFIAIGLVFAAISFLPPGRWMYRHITTKHKNKADH
jgi:formate-dependent nitrite reductase membrane component NrfD